MQKILLTGSTGFIGKAVLQQLLSGGFYVNTPVRRCLINPSPLVTQYPLDCINLDTDWSSSLKDCDTVIHCAGYAHNTNTLTPASLLESKKVNFEGTINLARQAAYSGVKRFIFLSSIGVNGGETINKPFDENDAPHPHSAYAISKYEAESGLISLSQKTGLEIVIIRPPLVYGKNAPGNYRKLLKLILSGWPLPLGGINNRLSLVGIDNLVDFIITCALHANAANQIFLISDDDDLSTAKLVRELVSAAGVRTHVFHMPLFILRFLFRLTGRASIAQRLCCNLQIDITKAKNLLGWEPLISVEEGLKRSLLN